jgi:hypothetical protein
MNCYIEVYGEGDDARCTIRYEHDLMFQGDKTNARVEALRRMNEVVQLLFGYPELQEEAKKFRAAISDIERYPMP